MNTARPHLPLVSFVIPVRNDARRLARCLETISANRYPPERVEIIVIDNGSSDDSGTVASQAGATVLGIHQLRVGELRNRGAQIANGDILAFVDADHELDPGWLMAAADVLTAPSVAVAGALCHAPPNGTWVQRAYDALRGHRPGQCDVEWLGSGNMAVWRRVFDELAGFDASLDTCEDVDLCRRVRDHGYRIVSDDRLKNVHAGDPATLMKLFRGELWRGRDNLRTSLRGPMSMRMLPSVVIPLLNLAMLAAGLAGLLTAPWGGLWVAGAAAMVVTASVLLRTGRMVATARPVRRLRTLAELFAVAAVYEMARALALAARAGHGTRVAHRPRAEPSVP